MALIAKANILYLSRQYAPGDELPTSNAEMVEAWMEAGTAEVVDEGAEGGEEETKPVKAVPKTAEPGLSGVSAGGAESDGEDLIGKVPKTRSRKKK